MTCLLVSISNVILYITSAAVTVVSQQMYSGLCFCAKKVVLFKQTSLHPYAPEVYPEKIMTTCKDANLTTFVWITMA